jgi:DNA-binding LacI/PurR family transcriptional regulator
MAKRRATLKDVAKKAGVSISTASRVSVDHPDVGDETKARVRAVMAELNYRPSVLARGLVSGRSYSLGLLVSSIIFPFYPHLARAVEEIAHEEGYVVFLCITYDDPEREKRYIDKLIAHGVDGILHASLGADESVLESLLGQGTPVVFANRRPSSVEDVDIVVYDSYGGARLAVRHLAELGHQHIAYIAGPEHISSVQERLAGLKAEMEAQNIPFRPELVQYADNTRQSSHDCALAFLQQNPRPTACLAIDVGAYGVLDAATELGLRVPEDLSIVGLGGAETAHLGEVPFTTISDRPNEMGRVACQRLIERIANPEKPPETIVLDAQLIIRNTTVKPPI